MRNYNSNEKLRAVIGALETHYTAKQSIVVGGHSAKVSDLIDLLTGAADANSAASAAELAWKAAIGVKQRANAEASTVLRHLANVVVGTFGAASKEAADFGFTPKPRAQPSVETRAAAAAKARATRAARHTMGRRQREAIVVAGAPAITSPGSPANGGAPRA